MLSFVIVVVMVVVVAASSLKQGPLRVLDVDHPFGGARHGFRRALSLRAGAAPLSPCVPSAPFPGSQSKLCGALVILATLSAALPLLMFSFGLDFEVGNSRA